MTEHRDERRVTFRINREARSAVVRPGDTLLHVLRRVLGLTGTKLGCENGDCGACTVQRDGEPIRSCYTLALDVVDAEITTIEGLRDTPVQRAFLEEYGFQCGYCTPGLIMNADALVRSVPDADGETIRAWLESNICRCTGYETIENAVRRVLASDDTASGGESQRD